MLILYSNHSLWLYIYIIQYHTVYIYKCSPAYCYAIFQLSDYSLYMSYYVYIYTHALFLLHATGPYYSSVRIQWETQGLEISGQDMHFQRSSETGMIIPFGDILLYHILILQYKSHWNPNYSSHYISYIYISQAMGITVTLQFKSQLRYISPVTWILIWYTLIPIRKNNSKLDPKFSIHYITHNMSVSENGVYWIFFL